MIAQMSMVVSLVERKVFTKQMQLYHLIAKVKLILCVFGCGPKLCDEYAVVAVAENHDALQAKKDDADDNANHTLKCENTDNDAWSTGWASKSFPQRPDPSNPVCCGSDALMPG